jgi:hypothetical protein
MMNKLFRCSGLMIVLGVFLTIASTSGQAQQTVYKWVDEDGVVHFSDAPPDGAGAGETETITTDKAPPVPAAQPVTKPAATPAVADDAQPAVDTPAPARKVDITSMSIAELDRRCDDAREAIIAPMRDAEIEKCKTDKRNDPDWCERFNADFGDGGRTVSGSIRPRMFDDLQECVDAQQELNRRGR